MAEDTQIGVAPAELDDDDLERELRHLYETRADTFFGGTAKALVAHTERMTALEQEYAGRFPDRVRPEVLRTRDGSRAVAGQDEG